MAARLIQPEQVTQLQRNIVISHAVGVGEPFNQPTTRAIMLIRANTLARGYSIVQRRDDGRVVVRVEQAKARDRLDVHVSDGSFPAEVSKQYGF